MKLYRGADCAILSDGDNLFATAELPGMADYIINRVNSHDELVAALQACAQRLSVMPRDVANHLDIEALATARAALEKAGK